MKGFIYALIACMVLFSSVRVFAQPASAEKPYISVTGIAEREVVPDEIYLHITISERYDGRDKISIDVQEQEIMDKIKALGINMADFSLSAADEVYRRAKTFKKDVMARRNYEVKVINAEMAGKVLDTLEAMNITNAGVLRFDYSKKEQLKKELQIEAVKAARNKAQYMLEALGQRAGKPILVEEATEKNGGNEVQNYTGRAQNGWALATQSAEDVYSPVQFEFRKIVYKSAVNVRFLIEQ